MSENRILILGANGNFGRRIATALAKAAFPIIIAGRNQEKIQELKSTIAADFPSASIETAVFDAHKELPQYLERLSPAVLINTCGPFQLSDYGIAQTCIDHNSHYIDLSDAREFVTEIHSLDQKARDAGVLIVSGASSVPGLSSAVLEHYKNEFAQIDSLKYGISPGQKANRGLATTQAIMSYVGKPLKPFAGHRKAYGWQDIYRQKFPELGSRWMANCEVPDLDLLPERYNIKSIQFSAGMELSILHLGIWLLSWLVRLGLPLNLPARAETLLKASYWFDGLGSPDGGMYMSIRGKDNQDRDKTLNWFVIAKNNHGPQIPTIPAIILAKKLAEGKLTQTGATPCVGLINLEEYQAELIDFDIEFMKSTP